MTDIDIRAVIKNYFLLFADPGFLPVLGLVVILVALQYRRSESLREAIFGFRRPGGVWRDTLAATLFGLAGGLVGSILIVFIGLPLTGTTSVFILLLVVAVLLMLINPRFLCLAYAGGIVSLFSIFTGWPILNVYQLLALVALLHLVESLLIFFSGHLGAVPAFFKTASGIVGGFTLQKFWPIPLVALTVAGISLSPADAGDMPHWWPLIKPGVYGGELYFSYALVAVVAGLGYGDLAIAHSPREKSRLSAYYLAIYSLVLLFLSVAAQYFRVLAPVAALFSPLGHELVIYVGKKTELVGRPFYASSSRGLKVLDVLRDSTAWAMGLRSGDILMAVNGIPVRERWELGHAVESCPGSLEIEYLAGGLVYRRSITHRGDKTRPLGILPISTGVNEGYIEVSTPGLLGGVIDSWRKKLKR
ncbi:MAG: hypothetical protein JL50_18320 [Peptococcaceae bacterium BICA1-7]|nr:MAG: hypothetical protein JL50_18320 [Peptococcaceae bacterium BICA1-7]HBV99111.1 PDZ domain-containing protein [Desulfotomaculum sp.]